MIKYLFLLAICFTTFLAHADLAITPLRVILSSKNRIQVLTLLNKDQNKSVTYRIGDFQYNEMNEDGSNVKSTNTQLTEKRQVVEQMITFSPRQVTLAPNESQTVRFHLRFPNNIPDGEYNTHISFKELEDKSDIPESGAMTKKDELQIVLKPLFIVSIPVFITKGRAEYKMSINDTKVDKLKHQIHFILHNDTNFSPIGNILIEKVTGKKLQEITKTGVVYIMQPQKNRIFNLGYDTKNIHDGDTIRISYIKVDSNETIISKEIQF